jgi:hypothetical protein
MKVEGGCHCRKVRFAAEVPAAVEVLPFDGRNWEPAKEARD